ncbi:FA complementation group G S homeolog isoform X1 [Xenopus laevis]|uniref:FA complementation group G S homeolog isoform X1 n=2 Tax=Xenopus laevis TaxID=8355 RepID=A0A1L8HS68_XENLA|nr:FA complementation group G S homeolog isoform X1 [Xenopus laevis]XP_018087565.1 FA complementation group G S homeolog isoform X1 [Xenopus laevis]XP_018087570.1 FA complementation group G S homeolog isoform X1 [Xenopus laevis]XP_018087578.1 FA complementation group G S homeolog isoform X1 [Xenopus laevis]OCT98944.1 hypothetical protein XELAEV_18011175mg [Xenopus laevis]
MAGDCLTLWLEENNVIVKQWRDSASYANTFAEKQKLQLLHADLYQLLQKIQGLPATPQSLPLELSVLYNMLIFHIHSTSGFQDEHNKHIAETLSRVLRVCSPGVNVQSNEELWHQLVHGGYSSELAASLHRLAGLQGALWLAEEKLHEVHDLFSLLLHPEDSECSTNLRAEEKLLALLKAWRVSNEAEEKVLVVQPVQQLRDVLYTSAAFLQGILAMEASQHPYAINLFGEAAESLCSGRVLAQVYTCLGFCFQKMEKPQTALQYWKQALHLDFQCLAALYHSSSVYKEMGNVDAELEALNLLYKALLSPEQEAPSTKTCFLIGTEQIVNAPSLTSAVRAPSPWKVKYLIARRCLKNKRGEEAVEHYLDLLALLQDESHQDLLPNPEPLIRIPEVFLETAAGLVLEKRYQDAMTVCEEVLGRTDDLIPGSLSVDSTQSKSNVMAEQLDLVLWASAAHLHQGLSHGLLGDQKESVTEYTKCINLLVKVQFIDTGCASPHCSRGSGDEMEISLIGLCSKEETVLCALKAAAFLGRSQQFLALGKQKESLLNMQLSLQASPAFPGAALTLVGHLIKLGRRTEAASYLKRYQSERKTLADQWEAMKRNLPLYLDPHINHTFPAEDSLIKELEESAEEMQSEAVV